MVLVNVTLGVARICDFAGVDVPQMQITELVSQSLMFFTLTGFSSYHLIKISYWASKKHKQRSGPHRFSVSALSSPSDSLAHVLRRNRFLLAANALFIAFSVFVICDLGIHSSHDASLFMSTTMILLLYSEDYSSDSSTLSLFRVLVFSLRILFLAELHDTVRLPQGLFAQHQLRPAASKAEAVDCHFVNFRCLDQ